MADYTSYTAAGLMTDMEGSKVNLILVLTNSHITMEPKADMTDYDAERDVKWDAKHNIELE